MHVEIHDKDGRVEIEDLTSGGIDEAVYQCERLIEELRDAQTTESEDDEDGTSGQDRQSYSDTQDRDSYTVSN